MNIRSLKQYAKYAAPLVSVVVIFASVAAAPLLKSGTTNAASWETSASCKAKNPAVQEYMRCLNQDSVEGMVFRAYQTVLGRTPEQAGFTYWVGVAKKNTANPTLAVVSGMMKTSEYGNRIMTGNPIVWVKEMYQRALYRTAGDTEVNYWVGQINNRKMTHQQVAAFFVQSAEQKRITAWEVPCYVEGENSQYCFNH